MVIPAETCPILVSWTLRQHIEYPRSFFLQPKKKKTSSPKKGILRIHDLESQGNYT